MEAIALFISEKFYHVFLAVLGVYVIVRIKNRHSDKKRLVYFTAAISVFLTYIGAVLIIEKKLPYALLPLVIAAVIAGAYFFLRRQWPFRLACAGCGKRLDFMTVIADDRNQCADCLASQEAKAATDAPVPVNGEVSDPPAESDESAESEQ